MRRHHAVWLVCLPLTAAGGFVTHVLACRFAEPEQMDRGHEAGHAAECLAAGLAVVLVALLVGAAHALRRGRSSAPPLWLFPLLPPFGFAVQEQVMHPLLGAGSPGLGLALALGFALQVPIALGIFLIARALLRIASSLVRALAGWRPRLVPLLPTPIPVVAPGMRRPTPLALGYAERGPPALVR